MPIQDTDLPANFGNQFMDQTVVHPLALAALIALALALVVVPRRFAIFPMIVLACFIPDAQRIVVSGLDFKFLRILVLAGWIRLLIRGELSGFKPKALDLALVLWVLCSSTMHIVLDGTVEAAINRLGFAFDALGLYFLFRFLIRGWGDVGRTVQGFILIGVPVAVAFLIENSTGRNAFSIFGGVPEMTAIREGRLRCQGAFSHPILAGCFWASLVPLMAALWWRGGAGRAWSVLGVLLSGIIVVTCASSTPVSAVLFAAMGLLAFPMRAHLRWLRWGVVLLLVGLHLVMNNPVWHLIGRVDFAGGSTGWHRFYLIDQTLRHFGEWWLCGTNNTAHWGEGLFDVTNGYVLEGVRGGLLTLILFVLVIAMGFGAVGRLWRSVEGDRPRLAMAWALGVMHFVHAMNLIAVSYFGQIQMIWYLGLAMIGSLAPPRRSSAVPARSPAGGWPGRRVVATAPGPVPRGASGVRRWM
jgi:hypothetical protein